ncbi:hypothetical protein Dda_8913 [Drechslerella dactyloides]|uniref:UBC core domain-containing protein n=1 Tax=Drechslerella dactyloides TaxID=74499 RepID=A0AAD6IQD9_DREDA|nr:hypothetical protein Dda_8913 [Drechslerella dactyloides]
MAPSSRGDGFLKRGKNKVSGACEWDLAKPRSRMHQPTSAEAPQLAIVATVTSHRVHASIVSPPAHFCDFEAVCTLRDLVQSVGRDIYGRMMASPSFREQQLLIEFATFRATPLPGVYLSLHPSTPTVWFGALFLRRPASAVYAGVPVRFSITFPKSYPSSPPFVVILGEKERDSNSNNGGGGGGGRIVGAVRHPLVVRGKATGGGGGGGGGSRGYVGAVNLKAGFPAWFEPKTATSHTHTNTRDVGRAGVFPPGTSPVEVVYWLRSIFTERYLSRLQARLDGDGAETGIIVDDEAWELWKSDRDELRRLVRGDNEDGEDDEQIFGEWEGDAPIRFLDLRREALDTIKENLRRRVTPDGEL